MEHAACHVVYLDKHAQNDRFERSRPGLESENGQKHAAEPEGVRDNVAALLSIFRGGPYFQFSACVHCGIFQSLDS